jgi:hypothetical protein
MRTIKTYFKGAPFYIASREVAYQELTCSRGVKSARPGGIFVVSTAGEAYAFKPEIQTGYSS